MSPVISNLLLKSTAETFYMLGVSALIAAVVGIPLGILLCTAPSTTSRMYPSAVSLSPSLAMTAICKKRSVI